MTLVDEAGGLAERLHEDGYTLTGRQFDPLGQELEHLAGIADQNNREGALARRCERPRASARGSAPPAAGRRAWPVVSYGR